MSVLQSILGVEPRSPALRGGEETQSHICNTLGGEARISLLTNDRADIKYYSSPYMHCNSRETRELRQGLKVSRMHQNAPRGVWYLKNFQQIFPGKDPRAPRLKRMKRDPT